LKVTSTGVGVASLRSRKDPLIEEPIGLRKLFLTSIYVAMSASQKVHIVRDQLEGLAIFNMVPDETFWRPRLSSLGVRFQLALDVSA
jgi:hypothetical protein